MAGQTLDVVTRGNDFKRIAFHGFIDIGKVPACTPRVKLINISGFNASASEMGDWVDYGMNAVMLGAYFNAGVWLVLDHGLPVAWCDAVRTLPK
ncbi:MAG: hypothetical protein CML20_10215 [Rheinheimera sp.]|nr:hypothetical protein [Rheinheimera sp.]